MAIHPLLLTAVELERECEITRTRRSGPGGQHRNKVETAVVITHRPTGVQAQASERRSQAENLAVAWQRLRVALAIEVRAPWSAEREVSLLWKSRVQGGKLRVSSEHADFGPLLAEALDRLAASDWEVATAAELLAISSSQLVKLLAQAPTALEQLNRLRRERGLHPLSAR
jgi:hypothetical protein